MSGRHPFPEHALDWFGQHHTDATGRGYDGNEQRRRPKHRGGDMTAMEVSLIVNGEPRRLSLDPRVTLLDALRDHLNLHGTKRAATMAFAAPARCMSMASATFPA